MFSDLVVSWKIVKDVLLQFGFKEIRKKGKLVYLYFEKRGIFVQVTKEKKIFEITLRQIMDQSQIPEEYFIAAIKLAKYSNREFLK